MTGADWAFIFVILIAFGAGFFLGYSAGREGIFSKKHKKTEYMEEYP